MNGKKGDDPVTDILFHKARVFSSTVDGLIAEIVQLGGGAALRSSFNLYRPEPLDKFEPALKQLRDRLFQEAKDRGWEV